MKSENKYLDELIARYPILSSCKDDIYKAYEIIVTSYEQGGKLMIAGNGGSAADSEHIVGELMKKFNIPRKVPGDFAQLLKNVDEKRGNELSKKLEPGLPAIALTTHEGLSTAFLNDVDGQDVYAQQLYNYGNEGDVFLGISTSGNSNNILDTAVVAKAKNINIIGLTGENGGLLSRYADVTIKVPENETFKIQELHLPVYHCLCLMLEDHFFGK